MRLLHTADWHVGRLLMNQPREEDIRGGVEEIIEIAREEKPDIIVHAGDLFDSIRPSYADMHWALDRLQELASIAPTVVLCGNHDSQALFALFDRLLGTNSRLKFIPKALPPSLGGIIEMPARNGELIRMAPVPFIHANRMIEHLEDPASWMATYADRVDRIMRTLGEGLLHGYRPDRDVLVLAAHLYLTHALPSYSERPIQISDAYSARAENLPLVSYVACGHIHRPQEIPGQILGTYAGSIVPMDFGEMNEQKRVVVVEAAPGRPALVRQRQLKGGRPLRRLAGSLQEIEAMASSVGRALVQVVVRTEHSTPDLAQRVCDLLPSATVLDVQEDCAASRIEVLTEKDVEQGKEPDFKELFRDYAGEHVHSGSATQILTTFDRLIDSLEQDEEPRFPEVAELEAVLPALSQKGP